MTSLFLEYSYQIYRIHGASDEYESQKELDRWDQLFWFYSQNWGFRYLWTGMYISRCSAACRRLKRGSINLTLDHMENPLKITILKSGLSHIREDKKIESRNTFSYIPVDMVRQTDVHCSLSSCLPTRTNTKFASA